MDNTLQPINLELSQLEKDLLDEYARLKADPPDGLVYIVLPREQTRGFLARLKPLYEALHGTGDTRNLQLVTELHDELRVRMMVLRNLLEREIPLIYLERALAELNDPEPSACSAIGSPPTDRYEREQPEPADGIFRRLLASLPLIGSLFREKTKTVRVRTVDRTPVENKKPTPPNHALPEHVMRTMGLHYLMEEDQLNLIKSGKELPRITHGQKLPASLARFVSRDLAEAHFATRASPGIARTPEELKRKLAERERARKE